MTTVADVLTRRGAELAYVIEFEGTTRAYCTTGDHAALLAAWTGPATMTPGLELPGSLARTWDVLGFALDVPSLTLQLVDVDGSVARLFATDSYGHRTNLTAAVNRTATTIYVASTSGFPASGTIYIGPETITYTGTTGTSFTGCTRGVGGFGGKATWAHSFLLGAAGFGAEVTDHPRVWKGRGVTVYITARDPDTGTWIAKADAVTWFCGFVAGYSYEPESGKWTVSCEDVASATRAEVLRDQFIGAIEGYYLAYQAFDVVEDGAAAVRVVLPSAHYSYSTLIEALNVAFAGAGLTHEYNFSAESDGRTKIKMHATAAATARITPVIISGYGASGMRVAGILGFNDGLLSWPFETPAAGDDSWTSEYAAIRAQFNPQDPTFTVVASSGTWHDQAADDLGDGSTSGFGFLRVGDTDTLWRCTTTDGLTFTKAMPCEYSMDLTPLPALVPNGTGRIVFVRVNEPEKLITLKQVWACKLPIGILLARLLVSTGTADYNA